MEGARDQVNGAVEPIGTEANPIVFKWFRDENNKPDWGKILLMLGVTILSGYLAAKSQRWGSEASDPLTTFKLGVAQKKITIGHNLQQMGKRIEEDGWAMYEAARP